MEYGINVDGIDFVIEQHSDASRRELGYYQRKRLLEYYKRLLKIASEEITPERSKALEVFVDNMTEENAKKKADYLDQKQIERILTYAEMFAKRSRLSPKADDELSQSDIADAQKMSNALLEVVDAMTEEDLDAKETVEINGNKFVYKKGTLIIQNYIQKLFDIGKQVKGNTWTVYLDKEGELVVY